MNGGPYPREYLARITAVRIDGVVEATPDPSEPPTVTYDAETYQIAGLGFVKVSNEEPANRRPIVDTFKIVPASVGDECWIRIVGGVTKLIVIEGVYAEECTPDA